MISKTKIKKIYLLILAFTSGLTIMAVEISAARLIAPYFGTSTFVWTNIIGVIMIALAIGYYLGGKLADQKPQLKLLLKIILIACLILLLIPFVTKPLVEAISLVLLLLKSASLLIFFGSLLLVSILFILPIILLGAVSPFIIKLMSEIDPHVGKDAGLVFSVSTFGSIFGTFLPILFFIPYLGTRKTIIMFSLLLLFIVLLGFLKRKWLLVFFVLLLPLLFMKMPAIKVTEGAVYEDESAYQYIQVVDEDNLRFLKMNEGYGISSVLNLAKDNVLTGYYYDFYNLLPYLSGNNKEQDVLILGLAGGIISTQLDHFFGQDYDLEIDGVEIDKKVIEVAKKYFNLENPSLTVHNFDGRNFLAYTDKKYDYIIIDVYSNQLYISFHLTTKEFFQLAKKHLKKNGIVAMNVNAAAKNSELLKSITNTMLLVFDNVYWLQEREYDWSFMVLASDKKINFEKLDKLEIKKDLIPVAKTAIDNHVELKYDYNFAYLIDDKAPIEHLTDWMILDYIFNNL